MIAAIFGLTAAVPRPVNPSNITVYHVNPHAEGAQALTHSHNAHTHAHIHIHIHIHMHMHMHMHTDAHTHTDARARAHTHTHTTFLAPLQAPSPSI